MGQIGLQRPDTTVLETGQGAHGQEDGQEARYEVLGHRLVVR